MVGTILTHCSAIGLKRLEAGRGQLKELPSPLVSPRKHSILAFIPYSNSHFEVQRRPDRQLHVVQLCFYMLAIYAGRFEQAKRGGSMLYWALVFLIVAIIAAIFGFGGVAVAAAGIAKLLFFIFLVVFIITLITGLTRRGRTGI